MGINKGCSVRLVLLLGGGSCAGLVCSCRLARASTAVARSDGDGLKLGPLTAPPERGLSMRVAAVDPGVTWLTHPLALFAGTEVSDATVCSGFMSLLSALWRKTGVIWELLHKPFSLTCKNDQCSSQQTVRAPASIELKDNIVHAISVLDTYMSTHVLAKDRWQFQAKEQMLVKSSTRTNLSICSLLCSTLVFCDSGLFLPRTVLFRGKSGSCILNLLLLVLLHYTLLCAF